MRFLYVILFVIGSIQAMAQQAPLYSQYMMNNFIINPAIAGSEGYTAINITAREQWTGFKDSPKFQTISGQSRILMDSYITKTASVRKRQQMSSRSGRVGLGGIIFNDSNGPVNRTGMQFSYAYHIRMQQNQLSFGLSGMFYQFHIDQDKIRFEEQDMFFENADKTLFIPDVSTGVYYSTPRLFAGLSATQLIQSAIRFGEKGYAEFKMNRHYFLTGGYNFDANDFLTIEPSFLLKANENLVWQLDINSRFLFYDLYWAGVSYRSGNALVYMGGIRVDRFVLSYSFDQNLKSIMQYTYGSHEIMVTLLFGDNARRYRWLKRF